MKRTFKSEHESEMFAMVKACLESGLTKKSFCKQQGISEGNFYIWLKRYKQKSPLVEKFIPVHVKIPEAFTKEIEIFYPNGVRVKISEGMELSQLRSLICLK